MKFLLMFLFILGNWTGKINLPFNTPEYFENLSAFDGNELIGLVGDTIIVVSDRWATGFWGLATSTNSGKYWTYENITGGYPSLNNWKDTIYIVYVISDSLLCLRKSTDGGTTWDDDTLMEKPEGGKIAKPSIAVWGQNVFITMEYKDTSISNNLFIALIKSTDGGSTWSDIQIISDITMQRDAWTPHIAVNENYVYVQWRQMLPEPDWGCQIYFRRSTDFGNNWESIQRLTPEDERWSDGTCLKIWENNIYVFFEDWIQETQPEPCYRIRMKKSTNNGYTWDYDLVIVDWEITVNNDTISHKFPWIDVLGDTILLFWQKWYINRSSYGIIRKPVYKISTNGGLTWNGIHEFEDTIYNPYGDPKSVCKIKEKGWYYVGYVVEKSTATTGNGDVVLKVSDEFPPFIPEPIFPVDSAIIECDSVKFIWYQVEDYGFAGLKGYKILIDSSQQYETSDTFLTVSNLKEGWHFWQVKAVDSLGNESEYSEKEFFKIQFTNQKIKEEKDKNNRIKILQKNIAKNGDLTLIIYSDINAEKDLEIFNLTGKKVFFKKIKINKGKNKIKIHLKKIDKGIYILQIGKVKEKIVKF